MVVWTIVGKTLTITWFVAVMMILVEYGNVLSVDRLRSALCGSRWTQYLVAALLGAVPGCLGAFVVVALFIHRSVRLGAVVACMIATSGDEAFVMLAIFPREALVMTLSLVVIGIAAGLLTDMAIGSPSPQDSCGEMVVHDEADQCRCFDRATILAELRRPSAARGTLVITTALFLLGILSGQAGPPDWGWVRVTLLSLSFLALFVVATVPEHFIEEHLWRHVVMRHVPRIFLWTLGSMAIVELLHTSFGSMALLQGNRWPVLLGAAVLGLIPESGPHLVVVMLYSDGNVPLSILMASSIVQDGHGMLPLLADSWRAFLKVKAINLVAGLLVASVMLLAGS